jgi:hypothetical protein
MILEQIEKAKGLDRTSLVDWQEECKKAGIDRRRFYDVKGSLVEKEQIIIEDGYFVRRLGVRSPVSLERDPDVSDNVRCRKPSETDKSDKSDNRQEERKNYGSK